MEFRVLGPLEIRDGERLVPVAAAKPRALLGVLLLHAGEVVSTSRLVDELWGERPPTSAPKLVQGYVHDLRQQLGPDTIVTQPPGYRIDLHSSTLDLLEVQRLLEEARTVTLDRAVELRRRALALWHGPALADVLFEGLARHEVGRLSDLRLTTQIERIDGELELGRHERVIGELESLVAAHPFQERLHAQLMLALYRSGRQAEALQVYQAARRALSDELGLEPGHVLRELEAAILRQEEALSLRADESSALTAPKPPKTPPADDELRPVTVLFADIVGSTALGERLPPDEVKALVGECVTQMSQAVEEYGGSVQAYEGDGICAYFGVPHAHEDDPERAARAALRILEVVGDYARDVAEAWSIPDFNVRVGINTGRAGVGTVGAGSPQTVALGDATNVAARIQSAARPGTIAVGEETARRLAHRFAFEELDSTAVQGRDELVRAARLAGPRAPSRAPSLRPLVGREREVGELENIVSEVQAGRGQVLVLVGEPGIGKTRLLAELRSLAGDEVAWLEGHCLSYGGLPSWPFVEVLRRWLGVELGDAEVLVRTRARARLAPILGADAPGALPALARLLRIQLGPELESRSLDPDGAADEVRRGYIAWIEALAAHHPVVLAIEDLHWAHASTRELAEDLLGLTDRAPLLLVVTLRRDPASEGWRFRTRVLAEFSHRATELSLDPLPDTAVSQLLATLLPGVLEDETREQIVARAEGNPLYAEELLRALLESGGLEQKHRTWTTTLKPSLLLPPALENLLVARIDRLPEGPRRLAQVAAAIGREFPAAALEHIAGEGAREDLGGLLRAAIVRELRRYPELQCAFRHGLLQEAALSTLTTAARRELYGRVAAAFEELYADSLDDHLERLAHYHAQSGDLPRAREYLDRAAGRASELGAETRAAELAERARRLS